MNEHTVETVKCAVCGAFKGATNHWRVLRLRVDRKTPATSLLISEWNEQLARRKGSSPACGNACTQKMVERYLGTGKLEAPRAGEQLS